MKPTLCIYHANCADGFGAAWIVRKALGPAAVAFHAATYNREPPDVRGRNIVLVDFSYPRPALPAARPVLESMLEDAHSIRLLDHHVTARDDLAGLTHPKLTAVFDLDQSGVGVTWRHYFPDRPLPPLLAHVQDMDLYRFALPRTREILSAVYSYPYDFDTWSRLMRSSLGRLVREGAILRRARDKDLTELGDRLTGVQPCILRLGRDQVAGPAYNVPYMFVGLAQEAAKMYPFAATYWITGPSVRFSLRSREGGTDVAALAQQYGAGGHVHAAGFEVRPRVLWRVLSDEAEPPLLQ
ncbi:phosphohydrolase [Acidiferrobacter sp. SPIII_3]|jgi:oligoribonuclease NrnB/cAMP/cGMP phosphodiesterase (DHH superfamily)|uniref:DHH family phosphoesterase n=1 Tax=Acidiferrobacter sp. SPIII_3 TaxID=1281578 RepID=UPI000D7261AE|nr:phosphohydrolase [Acidiferrobacter sp. SPIII_3]AWP22562.1 phosphohydrolase [Acidiferrobacter sp. SPIII_3]